MNDKLKLNLYDEDTVKWEHDGKLHCLRIQRDECSEGPREWDNITIMACWHRRYKLGDKIDDKEPDDFWQRLVRENVPEGEVFAAAEAGKLKGIRIAKNSENPELVDVYETYHINSVLGKSDHTECLEYEGIDKETAAYYLEGDLGIGHCMTLMEPYAEWLPLWLYDHSGITMSCGSRTGQYADRWDSGCVGWIVLLKKTIMEEVGTEYVLDENGDRIKVEHKHENGQSTWSFLTRPLTEETWRKRAVEIMESDVEVYDQYLTGSVYGFVLYEADPVEDDDSPDWNEVDSTWGYYGENIIENGICDEVGCGLLDAIRSGKYSIGKAELKTISYWEF